MDCINFETLIQEFLDAEITPENESILFTHISQCRHCRVSLQQYCKIFTSVIPESSAYPEALDARIMSSLVQKRHKVIPKETGNMFPAKYLYIAVIIILSLSGIMIFQAGRIESAIQNNSMHLQEVHSNFENQQEQLDYLLRTVPPVTVKASINRVEPIKSQL